MKQAASERVGIYSLCLKARTLIERQRYEESRKLITDAMSKYPDAPQPHNLMGVLLEKQNDHVTAIRHFRAACALDPTYMPSRCNLERLGTVFAKGSPVYDESDCHERRPAMCAEHRSRRERHGGRL